MTVEEGLQLHYISSPAVQTKRANLIVFLHGFPDSCHVFAHYLSSPLAEHANVVSLDLPSFGGSDGLPNYGPAEVLNAIVSAVIILKGRYLGLESAVGARRCILVGHDWGGAISSRLAMETTGLIDRVVIINGPIPKLFADNIYSGMLDARDRLFACGQSPRGTNSLSNTTALRPVLAQLIKSNYIFMFNLSFVNMHRFRFLLEYLVLFCHRAAARNESETWASWSWASSIGPGIDECTTSEKDFASYGNDTMKRAMRCPSGDWNTRIRLYKENLFAGDWSLRDLGDNTGVKQVEEGARVAFQCLAFILWGSQDFALDPRICIKGVERLFRPEPRNKCEQSSVKLLHGCGHWSPLETMGTSALLECLLNVVGANI